MPEVVTAWEDVEPVPLWHELTSVKHEADGPLHTQPMWDVSTIPPTPAEGIVEETALNSIMEWPTTPSVGTDLWRLQYDNNYGVRSHYYPAVENFKTSGSLMASSFPVMDPDSRRWRENFASDRVNEWRAAHPTETAAGATVTLEWEGWAESTRTTLFGQHSSRELRVSTVKSDTTEAHEYVLDEDDQLALEGPITITPATILKMPALPTDAVFTYTLNPGATVAASDLAAGERVLNDVMGSGTLASLPISTEGVASLPIPDAVFEAQARPMVRDVFGFAQEWTRGFQVWALPNVPVEWRGNWGYFARAAPGGTPMLSVWTSFQPPRWRLRIVLDGLAATPYRRTFPRHDSLAGGPGRNYPPSRALQTSNRIGGGYL